MFWTIKPYLICDVKPGMVLGRPIISDGGKIALVEDTVLNGSLIERLTSWGFHIIYIKEPCLEDSITLVSLEAEQRAFTRRHSELSQDLKNAFENTRYFKEVPLAKMKELADQSIESLINTTGVMSHLKMIHSTDDYTFRHSLNVGVIVGVLGKWLGFSGAMLKDIVLAGLLHDIGKTQIPLAILNKPGKLTRLEMDIMQEHATFGYDLVKHNPELSKEITLAVWQHHERLDGQGYPFRLTGAGIVLFAKVIAVADVYDAMTSNRVYQKASTPFKVIDEVFSEMFNKLDPDITLTFLQNLKDSLIGYIVRLSDGSEAKVIYLDKARLVQPIVKLADGRYLDLERRRDLNIIEVIAT